MTNTKSEHSPTGIQEGEHQAALRAYQTGVATYHSATEKWAKLKGNSSATQADIVAADAKARSAYEEMCRITAKNALILADVFSELEPTETDANMDSSDEDTGHPEAEQEPLVTINSENWDEARRRGFEWVANLDRPIDGLGKKELAKAREWYDPENVLIGDAFNSLETHRPVQDFGRAALYARRPPHIDNHLPMRIDPSLGPLTLSERQPDYKYPGRE
jgi:hypothetical protein